MAVRRLRDVRLRPEVVLEEVPAPQRIAPFALALSADVVVDDEELATGRFVLLHDPAAPEAWEGTFRVVSFVRAVLEPELGADPMLGQVGWSWLEDALSAAGVAATAAGRHRDARGLGELRRAGGQARHGGARGACLVDAARRPRGAPRRLVGAAVHGGRAPAAAGGRRAARPQALIHSSARAGPSPRRRPCGSSACPRGRRVTLTAPAERLKPLPPAADPPGTSSSTDGAPSMEV